MVTMLLSFWKKREIERLYRGMGSIVAITGIVGSFLVRDALVKSLDRSRIRFNDEERFIQWALSKFDTFALWSLLVLVIIIVVLLLYIWINKQRLTPDKKLSLTVIIVLLMVASPIAAIVYGFGTINKEFDVAAYILTLSICELSILYIPLLFKRIMAIRVGAGRNT
ncbi:hypothetical protein J4772_24295 [Cohnella sp. LGH]|uniref:hypothetical protein n=1 Tax=Cohnella sp. LGH TaxID=1619153 RepID=UPI001ADA234F|nr:hypothetical protein [Cohnella sp. LGH]QTH40679.1 hypothetical protein J4772_24295 [Cohnella sp. LGH]